MSEAPSRSELTLSGICSLTLFGVVSNISPFSRCFFLRRFSSFFRIMAELVIALLVTSIHAIHATRAEKATLLHMALHPKIIGFLSLENTYAKGICKPILGLLDSEGPTVMMPCWGL